MPTADWDLYAGGIDSWCYCPLNIWREDAEVAETTNIYNTQNMIMKRCRECKRGGKKYSVSQYEGNEEVVCTSRHSRIAPMLKPANYLYTINQMLIGQLLVNQMYWELIIPCYITRCFHFLLISQYTNLDVDPPPEHCAAKRLSRRQGPRHLVRVTVRKQGWTSFET